MSFFVGGTQECSDGYMCKTQFRIKNEASTPHVGTPASVLTCLPTEVSSFVCHEPLFSLHEVYSLRAFSLFYICFYVKKLNSPWILALLAVGM